MLKRFQGEYFSIPNVLSYVRIILIPVFAVFYMQAAYYKALIVLILSALTDIVDGKIARHFGLVTDFGKIIDPIADKLTQITVFVFVALRHEIVILPLSLLVIKEACMLVCSFILIKKIDKVNSAMWYGKVCTVILYTSFMFMLIFPEVSETVVAAVMIFCSIVILATMFLYGSWFLKILAEHKVQLKSRG